jgi:transcription initiation factor IIE alpha subunit
MFLKTLYEIIYKLGEIDELPNMPDVLKTINELSILHNAVYKILKSTTNKTKCIAKLGKLTVINHTEPVFSKEQVLEIISNREKIMKPFDTVFYHRENKTAPSKLQRQPVKRSGSRFQLFRSAQKNVRHGGAANEVDDAANELDGTANEEVAGEAVVVPDLTEQISALEKEIKDLQEKTQDTQKKERDLRELKLIQELQEIMTTNTDIEQPPIKKIILDKLTEIHNIQEQRKTLGCLKKDFEEGQGIWAYIPDFMRPTDTGGKIKEYMDMFVNTKNSIIGTAKDIAIGLGIDDLCMLINKKVEVKDWILYPMWSLEQTLYIGEGISVQLDFLSLIVSQLDALFKLGAMSMSGAKMGIIQSALTGMAASTGGVAIAAAPVIGPAMGVAYDVAVYLFGNMANIINMFIMISRKKHDGAFTLLTDIIPGMATTLNKAVNFLSILTSLSGKTINVLDQFTALLDSSFLKEKFIGIDGPMKLLPVVGEMVKDKVTLHSFVEENMPAANFQITDEMMEYPFPGENEGKMEELDPNIKAAYIIDKELYPCVLLDTQTNMIYVGKYYNERFLSSIKRQNIDEESPWEEENNNIFIGNINEIKSGTHRQSTDYSTLNDCGYRLFVKDNSNNLSVFHKSYGTKDITSVTQFKKTMDDVDEDKYADLEEMLQQKIEAFAPESADLEIDGEYANEEENDDDTLPPPQEDEELPPVRTSDGGGYKFKSKIHRKSRKVRKSKSKRKSLKHKKLNQYSRKYIRNKRRNVSLRNH